MKPIMTFFLLGVFCISFGQTLSERDKKFAQEACEGNLMEVQLGELSQRNGITPEVKKHGRHMVEDHSKANEELKELAGKKNIQLPAKLGEKKQKEYDKMYKLTGKIFDRAYSKMMIDDHKKDIALFKAEAKKGDDPDLKAWASEKIATLENHLQMWNEAHKAAKK